jgi:hypothetical protein
MRTLSDLFKFYGCYDTCKTITQNHDLKWTISGDLEIFKSLMENNGNNYFAMLDWLKDTCSKIPKEYGNILVFNTLTGLHPDDACQSVDLIQIDLNNCYEEIR